MCGRLRSFGDSGKKNTGSLSTSSYLSYISQGKQLASNYQFPKKKKLQSRTGNEVVSLKPPTASQGMPPYLSDLLHPYQPPRTLRSLDTSLLSVPRFCLETFGRRSFSVFGPTVWNSLPLSLRKTQCFSTFKKKLKTHLFEKHLS